MFNRLASERGLFYAFNFGNLTYPCLVILGKVVLNKIKLMKKRKSNKLFVHIAKLILATYFEA